MNGDESDSSLYRVLLDRCRSLEASYRKLEEQLQLTVQEQRENKLHCGMTSYTGSFTVPGVYKRVLDSVGHAVFVSRIVSQETIYWNRSAEQLFGYKDHEVLGQRVLELLIDDKHHVLAEKFMGNLSRGLSWSGQFPFKKRSGEIFMALVNKSPLYEDGELAGIITVSCDAALFNKINLDNQRTCQDPDNGQTRVRGMNLKKIHWHPQPQISSFVSNLASREILPKHGANSRNTCTASGDREENILEPKNVTLEKPPKAPAAKVLSKLRILGTRNLSKDDDQCIRQDASIDISAVSNDGWKFPNSPRSSKATTSYHCVIDAEYDKEISHRGYTPCAAKRYANANEQMVPTINQLEKSGFQFDEKESEPNAVNRQAKPKQYASSDDSNSNNHATSLRKGENDLSLVVDCEIRWEDLTFREEIGHGSCALVYRGIWNGSDVAIKVFSGNQYGEDALLDYKKEIGIMRRLRHPNVLLFMGAVCSWEKLAIVTELLPRGSLFKILHKNSHLLDISRRLRMALDVARGMNYLHHRNPPIVHRDLKSSNLLVDKSWSVKVGDFGLSKLKNTTFLTARSGRGTPQWMAPEVLRNEPSNEKSDVYSFGVIVWELVTESIPWSNLNPLQVVGVVGFMDRRLDMPEGLNPSLSSIIHDCWQSNPEQRPSFENIILRMTDLIQKLPAISAQQ